MLSFRLRRLFAVSRRKAWEDGPRHFVWWVKLNDLMHMVALGCRIVPCQVGIVVHNFESLVEHVLEKRVNRSRVKIALLKTPNAWLRTMKTWAHTYPTHPLMNAAHSMAIDPSSISTLISSIGPSYPTSAITSASKRGLCAIVFAKGFPSRFDRYLSPFDTVYYLHFIDIIRCSDIGTKCCARKSRAGKQKEREAFRKGIGSRDRSR